MLVREGRGEHIHLTQTALELCLGTTDSLEISLSHISTLRLQLWREQPCSFPCPQRAGNAGHEKGWEQGVVPAPCSQTPAGTTEEMCQKIRVTLVPDSPKEVSREKAPTDHFSP